MILARPTARHSATTFLVIAGVIAAVHFAADVLIPIALALLLAFLLAPLVDRIQRIGANRAVSVVLTTLITLAVTALVFAALARLLHADALAAGKPESGERP
jgi:predicted PurR-regulated permease PerM